MSDDVRRPEGWPDPNERPCEDCGHVWFAGQRRHEYVDPVAERPEDVTVLCVLCRRRRDLAPVEPQDGADDRPSWGWRSRSPGRRAGRHG